MHAIKRKAAQHDHTSRTGSRSYRNILMLLKYLRFTASYLLAVGLLSVGPRLIVPLFGKGLGGLRVPLLSSECTLVTALATGQLLLLVTALAGVVTLHLRSHRSTDAFETTSRVFTVVLATMTKLSAGLTRDGLAETPVHVLRGGAHQSVASSGLGGLLAVTALDSRVEILAGDVTGMRPVRAASRRSARRERFGVEFRDVVLRRDLATGLMLKRILVSTDLV